MRESATALHDLKMFNRMVAGHQELADRLITGEYHFLQWQQAKIFSAFRTYREHTAEATRATTFRNSMTASLFISGVASCALTACAALFRKVDVVVFSADKISSAGVRDFRIEGLYKFLETRGIAHIEVFHTMLGRTLFRNAWARKRCAIYHEAFDFLAAFRPRSAADVRGIAASSSCGEFDEADRSFVRALIEKCLRRAATSNTVIRWYRRALARLKPRAILAIDDTRYYHELIAAARTLGIPSYAFQHGHFTKYHAGWLDAGVGPGVDARPDALFVWNPYWKKELLRLGTNFKEDEIRVGGNPKGDASLPVVGPYAPPTDDRLEILVPFETDAPHDEIARALKALADSGKVKIWLKTRPDWETGAQLRAYGLEGSDVARAEAVADAAPVLERIHAVVGVFTSYLYEAVAMRKPVFLLTTSMDGGEGMIVNGLADRFDALDPDAAARLAAACRTAAPKLESRAETYLRGAGSLTATLETLLSEA